MGMSQHTQHTEVPSTTDLGHNIVHTIMDSGGLWWLLAFAALGVLGLFKNKIREWIKK